MERARSRGLERIEASEVLVIGDTPADVACAAAVGVKAVAVATGSHDAETLRAAGATIVFEDLSDTARFLALLEADEAPKAS